MALDYATKVIEALALSATTMGGAMMVGAAGVGAAIAAVGVASVAAATTFDQSMHRIGALTDTSAAQMQAYKDAIIQMAPQLDVAPTALADALYFVVSAGYSGSKALDIMALSAKAAAATMTPMKDVSDLLTTAMNAYRGANLSAGEAMDDIVKIVVNGKVQMSNLATSFGFVAVTAQAAGLSFKEASAAVSDLSQVAGAHGSRRVMMDLDNLLRSIGIDADAVAKRAKGMGLAFNEAKFAGMSFIDKLNYLATLTGGVGYLDKTAVAAYEATGDLDQLALATAHANSQFKSLVGGAAAFIPAAILLSDKGKEYNVILNQMDKSSKDFGVATQQAFDVMRQSTGQQWKMFVTTVDTLAVVVGLHLLPAVNAVLTSLRLFGISIIDWLQAPGHMEQLKFALIGIGLVITAILIPALWGMAAAWLAGPGGLITGSMLAIVAVGTLLGLAIKWIGDQFGGWDRVLKSLQPTIDGIRSAWAQFWAQMKPFLDVAGQALAGAGDAMKRAFADPAVRQALEALKPLLPYILMILGAIIALPLLTFVGVIVGLAFVIRGLAEAFAFVAHWVAEFINSLAWLISQIPSIIAKNVAGIRALPAAIMKALTDQVGLVAKEWDQFTWPIRHAVDVLIKDAKDWGANLVKQLVEGIQNGIPGLKGAIDGMKGVVNHVFQGHSPPAGWPEQGEYGANLVRVFAAGIAANQGLLTAALTGLVGGANQAVLGGGAAGGTFAGVPALGGASSPVVLGGLANGGAGGAAGQVTINASFPNAVDRREIRAAFDEMQRQDYAKSRRAGAYQQPGGRY